MPQAYRLHDYTPALPSFNIAHSHSCSTGLAQSIGLDQSMGELSE